MFSRVLALVALCCLFVAGCEEKADAGCRNGQCGGSQVFSFVQPQAYAVQSYAIVQPQVVYAAPIVQQQKVIVQKQFAFRQQAVVAYPQAVVVEQRVPRRSIQRSRTVIRNR